MLAKDPPGDRQPKAHTLQRLALVVIFAGYALAAATTTAFTGSADLVTALPIVVLVVLVLACWPLRPGPVRHPAPVPLGPDQPDRAHPWRAWVVLCSAIAAWELADYAARGSRARHPTLSSMLDAVDRTYLLKAVVFFLWLCLGAAIARSGRRGRRRPDPQTDPQTRPS